MLPGERRVIRSFMNAPLRRSWTREEFFGWADGQDGRYEFDGFRPVDMNGGTIGHAIIIQNLNFALRDRLRNTQCRVLGPGAGVATIGQAVRYPDIAVTCSKLESTARMIPYAVALFEVLSPSTSRTDRIDKVREYAAIETVRRYVILESTSIGAMALERAKADEVWRTTTLLSGDVLEMQEIGVSIPVLELYEGVDFPA